MRHESSRWEYQFGFLVTWGLPQVWACLGEYTRIKKYGADFPEYQRWTKICGRFSLDWSQPRKLQERFLKSENGLLLHINPLSKGLQGALWLEQLSRSDDERDQVAEAMGTALRLLLQGWNYAGHLALLDGLRVSYPNASSGLSPKMILDAPPSCFPNLGRETVQINDLCMAQGFFEQGLRLVLNTLAANRTPAPLLVMDVKPLGERYTIEETDKEGNKIKRRVDGWFNNDKVPQYTYYDVPTHDERERTNN